MVYTEICDRFKQHHVMYVNLIKAMYVINTKRRKKCNKSGKDILRFVSAIREEAKRATFFSRLKPTPR